MEYVDCFMLRYFGFRILLMTLDFCCKRRLLRTFCVWWPTFVYGGQHLFMAANICVWWTTFVYGGQHLCMVANI
jgi:hypothetical protein